MTTMPEYDDAEAQATMRPEDQPYMGLREVADYLGVSRQAIANWRKQLWPREFPKQIAILKMGPVWTTEAVVRFKAANETRLMIALAHNRGDGRPGRRNEVGNRYGRLLVVARGGGNPGRTAKWRCRCDCGNITVVAGDNLRHGLTRSCGCLTRSRSRWRGMSQDAAREYSSWRMMVARCENPKFPNFPRYGGANPPVTVCARWRESFPNFYADMGSRPEGTSLDRWPDPCGNYEPTNCRWATPEQQAHNKRKPAV